MLIDEIKIKKIIFKKKVIIFCEVMQDKNTISFNILLIIDDLEYKIEITP
jgi:hypothetical protein